MSEGILVAVSGFSGAGKGTLMKELLKKYDQYALSISATTRQPRPGELFADKICTDEETVRLKSHITNMKQALTDGNGVGRKLDFIAQEMNREANTILSKANDLATSEIAIELKTEIEKVREQIQNIE